MPNKLRYLIEYFFFRLLERTVRLLPRSLALLLGAGLGKVMPLVQPGRKRKARENLRRAFPHLPEDEIQTLLRESFRHLGISGVEVLRLELYYRPEALERYFVLEGLEHLQPAFAQGKGVIILAGHLGFWEAGNKVLPILGYPLDYIYKRVKNPYIEAYLLKVREIGGGIGIEKRRAALRMIRSLNENRAVGILIDQRQARSESIQVDFFGHPVNTTPVIAQVALKRGTPVLPGFCYRLPDNRYRMVLHPPLPLHQTPHPSAEEIHLATQLMTDAIEAAIREEPAQWFWVHDRWRL